MNQFPKQGAAGAAWACLSFPTCTTGGVGAVTGPVPPPALAPCSPCTKAGHQQPGGAELGLGGQHPRAEPQHSPRLGQEGGHQHPRRAGSPAQLSLTPP